MNGKGNALRDKSNVNDILLLLLNFGRDSDMNLTKRTLKEKFSITK